MISRYRVWLNDIQIADVSPQIYVSDISYQSIADTPTYSQIAVNDGQFTGKSYVKENTITVSFAIREYNTALRQEIIQNVISWASKGGWLKTSDRTGQRIYVRPTRFPAVQSVLDWTDDLSIEFKATDYPFWTDEFPETELLASGESGTIRLGGTWKSYVEAEVIANDSLSSLEITVGNTSITLEGLTVSAGDTILIHYSDDHHILGIDCYRAGIWVNSLLDKRTADSDDDLIAEVGANSVSFVASGSAFCEIAVKKVYM